MPRSSCRVVLGTHNSTPPPSGEAESREHPESACRASRASSSSGSKSASNLAHARVVAPMGGLENDPAVNQREMSRTTSRNNTSFKCRPVVQHRRVCSCRCAPFFAHAQKHHQPHNTKNQAATSYLRLVALTQHTKNEHATANANKILAWVEQKRRGENTTNTMPAEGRCAMQNAYANGRLTDGGQR